MNFAEPLQQGRFKRRYKRFFAEIEFGGKTITAHVPNTGSLRGCLNEGAPCLFSTSKDPARKLPHTLQMVQDEGTWVGVNTNLANDLAWEAWQNGDIPGWKKFDGGQREVKIHAKTRLDLALWKSTADLPATTKLTPAHLSKNKFYFIEVKNVTMASAGLAMFPDSVTERGQKHLKELMELAHSGHKAEIFFLVQRGDCQAFAPADAIDPVYGKLLRQAIKNGVKISAYPCELNATGAKLKARPLALEI
ncbi:MAG: DNA/RNA nuclease SfsA [Bdellovibrionales bacterium]